MPAFFTVLGVEKSRWFGSPLIQGGYTAGLEQALTWLQGTREMSRDSVCQALLPD